MTNGDEENCISWHGNVNEIVEIPEVPREYQKHYDVIFASCAN